MEAWLIIYSVDSPLPVQVLRWTSDFEVGLELQQFCAPTWQMPGKSF